MEDARENRLSPSALRVLELLRSAAAPVKAYDLLSQLEVGRLAKPPTVYRALNQLAKAGLAHRVFSLDAFIACDLHGGPHQPLFLLCEPCGRISESLFDMETLEGLRRAPGPFHATSAVLEVTGVCEACRRGDAAAVVDRS